jgi:hypothetical protein
MFAKFVVLGLRCRSVFHERQGAYVFQIEMKVYVIVVQRTWPPWAVGNCYPRRIMVFSYFLSTRLAPLFFPFLRPYFAFSVRSSSVSIMNSSSFVRCKLTVSCLYSGASLCMRMPNASCGMTRVVVFLRNAPRRSRTLRPSWSVTLLRADYSLWCEGEMIDRFYRTNSTCLFSRMKSVKRFAIPCLDASPGPFRTGIERLFGFRRIDGFS